MISTPAPRKSCWDAQKRRLLCGSHYSKKLAGPHTRITCTLCVAPLCMSGNVVLAWRPTRRHYGQQHLPLPWPLYPSCWQLLWHSVASWGLWPSHWGQIAAPLLPPFLWWLLLRLCRAYSAFIKGIYICTKLFPFFLLRLSGAEASRS